MTAPGREGERAQECMASCFQAMAAAKPIGPPGHKPCPTTAARPAMGGAGDTDHRLCTAAGPHTPPHQGWPTACHSPGPLHLPLSPTALGTAAPTLNNRFADVSQSCRHPHRFCDHVCVSAVLQFRLPKGTNPDLDAKAPHRVSDHNVHEGLFFCLSQCRGAEGCPVPGHAAWAGAQDSLALLLRNRSD